MSCSEIHYQHQDTSVVCSEQIAHSSVRNRHITNVIWLLRCCEHVCMWVRVHAVLTVALTVLSRCLLNVCMASWHGLCQYSLPFLRSVVSTESCLLPRGVASNFLCMVFYEDRLSAWNLSFYCLKWNLASLMNV